MKASKTENRFETGFHQPKTGLPKELVLTSLNMNGFILGCLNQNPTPKYAHCSRHAHIKGIS